LSLYLQKLIKKALNSAKCFYFVKISTNVDNYFLNKNKYTKIQSFHITLIAIT